MRSMTNALAACLCAGGVAGFATTLHGAEATGEAAILAADQGPKPIAVELEQIDVYRVTTSGFVTTSSRPVAPQEQGPDQEGPDQEGPDQESPDQETCQQEATHTDADFTGGSFTAQAGFSTGEILATTYQLTPADFPIRVDTVSAIFVTSGAAVQTVTEWSVLVWDGTPQTGTLVAEFSADDVILPFLRVGPGTQGVDLQVQVDPNDAQPIIVFNNSGTAQFSVGFRIDRHNAPSNNPCLTAPNQFLNAFPTTDTSTLNQPTRNWLFGLDCGILGCPPDGGWTTLGNLNFLCRPSGDWVVRAFWQRADCQPGVGACCFADGSCATALDSDCIAQGGTYQGDGVRCDEVDCPVPTGACCNPGGGCLELGELDCDNFGGSWAGAGTDCEDLNGNGIADDCDGACPADLSSPTDPGTPDGVLTGADFFEFLSRFNNGDLSIDFAGPLDPTTPDGVLTGADFFRFLDLFSAGC